MSMPKCVFTVIVMMLCLTGAVRAAPDVDVPLVALDGASSSLAAQFNGEDWLLVMVWSTTCPICRAETPQIQALSERQAETGIRVIGIALEGQDKLAEIRRFGDELGVTYDNFTGVADDIIGAYAAATGSPFRGTPTFLLYTPDGELVGDNPGPIRPGAVERFIEKYNRTHS